MNNLLDVDVAYFDDELIDDDTRHEIDAIDEFIEQLDDIEVKEYAQKLI